MAPLNKSWPHTHFISGLGTMVVFAGLAHRIFSSGPILLATPERQPRFASLKKPSTQLRNRSGLRRSWRRFRPDVRLGVSPDRNRNAIPTGLRHAGCRCRSRSCRLARHHSRRASIPHGHRSIGDAELRALVLDRVNDGLHLLGDWRRGFRAAFLFGASVSGLCGRCRMLTQGRHFSCRRIEC